MKGQKRAYKFEKKNSQDQGCNTEEQDFVDMMMDSKLLRRNNDLDMQQISKGSEASPATNQNEISPLLDRNREKLLQRQISEYKPATQSIQMRRDTLPLAKSSVNDEESELGNLV